MGGRILIIEDNPANLDLMSYVLCAFGHVVHAAVDGQAGLEAMRRERPDLVICDVQIPILDGFEVAKRAKGDAELRHIPLVAVTALAMVGDREKVLAAGFDGYLAKPIEPESFASSVARYLSKQLRQPTVSSGHGVLNEAATPLLQERKRMVLVVDDSPVNLEFASILLRHAGYDVITAQAIDAAMRLAREHRPALILSDVCLGTESGFDLIAQMKADAHLRTTPFTFITSTLLSSQDRAKGLALGAARYLVRPIEPQQLLKEIAACLQEAESMH